MDHIEGRVTANVIEPIENQCTSVDKPTIQRCNKNQGILLRKGGEETEGYTIDMENQLTLLQIIPNVGNIGNLFLGIKWTNILMGVNFAPTLFSKTI